jgi:ABC-type tungstate transport system substrate-binding protein
MMFDSAGVMAALELRNCAMDVNPARLTCIAAVILTSRGFVAEIAANVVVGENVSSATRVAGVTVKPFPVEGILRA